MIKASPENMDPVYSKLDSLKDIVKDPSPRNPNYMIRGRIEDLIEKKQRKIHKREMGLKEYWSLIEITTEELIDEFARKIRGLY